MSRLILASTSPYRRTLLERLGLAFEQRDPGVIEDEIPAERPAERAVRLAAAKAAACQSQDSVVIGSDQVAACGQQILHKPGSAENAVQQLLSCQNRSIDFFTAVSITNGVRSCEHIDHTVARFRPLSTAAIRRYVELDAPYACAGGFRIESLGVALFESVESRDPTALIGLPLIWVAKTLSQFGLDPLRN